MGRGDVARQVGSTAISLGAGALALALVAVVARGAPQAPMLPPWLGEGLAAWAPPAAMLAALLPVALLGSTFGGGGWRDPGSDERRVRHLPFTPSHLVLGRGLEVVVVVALEVVVLPVLVGVSWPEAGVPALPGRSSELVPGHVVVLGLATVATLCLVSTGRWRASVARGRPPGRDDRQPRGVPKLVLLSVGVALTMLSVPVLTLALVLAPSPTATVLAGWSGVALLLVAALLVDMARRLGA